MSRCLGLLLVCWGILGMVGQVSAETFSGRITKISADSSRITVFSTSQKKEQTFALNARELRITLDGKSAKADQLEEGMLVTVLTSSGDVAQRILARANPSPTPSGAGTASTKPSADNPPASPPTPPRNEPNRAAPRAGNNTAGQNKAGSEEPWPNFLGPDGRNHSADQGLLKTWPAEGPRLLWTARNLGEGYSSVSIAEGKVFTLGTRQGQEVVLALDLASGQELWSAQSGSIFNDNMGNGPRSTPTYEAGRIYCLGASGDLNAIDTATGNVLWHQNILERYSAKNIVWGISESPLLDGDKLICTPGGQGATMVALNKQDGNRIWQAAIPQNPQAGYSTAIIAELNGTRQYVNFCHSGIFGVDAKTGQPLWGDSNAANSTANCSSPIAIGNNSLFYASAYGTGGALLRFTSRQAKPSLVYKTEKMKNHHGGMVELDGHIYGANENILTCLNAQNGSVTWQERLGGQGKGAITYADGHLYFRSENGPMFLIEANPSNFVQKAQFEQPQRSSRPSWARPVVADGKLFLRDQDILLCYDVTE